MRFFDGKLFGIEEAHREGSRSAHCQRMYSFCLFLPGTIFHREQYYNTILYYFCQRETVRIYLVKKLILQLFFAFIFHVTHP